MQVRAFAGNPPEGLARSLIQCVDGFAHAHLHLVNCCKEGEHSGTLGCAVLFMLDKDPQDQSKPHGDTDAEHSEVLNDRDTSKPNPEAANAEPPKPDLNLKSTQPVNPTTQLPWVPGGV